MPESLRDDTDLWKKAQKGQQAAREELAGLAQELARGELRRRGAPPQELEDLVQEAVRSTISFLDRGGEAPKDLRAFLKYRAWGVLSDFRKKMRHRDSTTQLEEVPETVGPDSTPDEPLQRGQLETALTDCRGGMNENLRAVLGMRYDSGFDTTEIANRLDIHRNTVNVRVFRALQALRECLTRKGFDAGDLT